MDSLEPNSMPSTNSASPGFCSSDNFESETEGTGLPWKHREILTFDIPVHDSERAGLGVSVKGKTSTSRGKSGTLLTFSSYAIFSFQTSQIGFYFSTIILKTIYVASVFYLFEFRGVKYRVRVAQHHNIWV